MELLRNAVTLIVLASICYGGFALSHADKPWHRYTIDDSSRGADGVRLMDVNGDGHQDIVTGWEQGGKVRVYLNPGPTKAKEKWPAVTVGEVRSPEDAVFADVDGDGAVDVVSCCEGNTRNMFVHWAPKEKARYLNESEWVTEAFPVTSGQQWMFCLPMQVDGKHGVDLVIGAKGAGAQVGWLEAPSNPREVTAWQWHPMTDVGWTMSLMAADVNGDSHYDVILTDRKGASSGCFWLENPGRGEAQKQPWKRRLIGGAGREVMFAALDTHGQGVVTCAKERDVLFFRREFPSPDDWKTYTIPFPGKRSSAGGASRPGDILPATATRDRMKKSGHAGKRSSAGGASRPGDILPASPLQAGAANTGRAKGINVGDLNLDGKPDLILSCEAAGGERSGVFWMSYRKSLTDTDWEFHDLSGPQGVKFDLIELLDLDGDGDRDVITTEETANLGVIWYENPTK